MHFLDNVMQLLAGLRLWRVDVERFNTGTWDMLLALTLAVLTGLLPEWFGTPGPLVLAPWALEATAGWYAVLILLMVMAAAVMFAFRQAAALLVGGLYIWAFGNVITFLLVSGYFGTNPWVVNALALLPPLMLLLIAFAMLRGRAGIAMMRAIGFLAVFSVGQYLMMDSHTPPYVFYSQSMDTDDTAQGDHAAITTEDLYYAQPRLMTGQINALVPQRPDETDVYGLILGGTAHQSVFMTEAESVGALLARNYDAEGRIITLVNSTPRPTDYPMANSHNLRHALAALAARMDTAQDIAFLYLTSHGSPDSFSLHFSQAALPPLRAAELDAMLDASGIRNAVIVISACYSGSFIDDLQDENRLIITSASDSTTSFGCADGVDWTWWGRAFFDEALALDHDFRRAFDAASGLVSGWEQLEGYDPSRPQMWQGDGIAHTLDRYMTTRADRRAALD